MTFSLREWVFAAAFALGAAAGCTCDPTNYQQQQYACVADEDCATGRACVAGVCTDTDGGTTGGGQGGGAGGGSGGGAGGGVGGGTGGGADGGADDSGVVDAGEPCVGAGRPCYPYGDGLADVTLFYTYDGGAGCAAGFQACVNGYYAPGCANAHTPQLEFCDGRDTDCDGVPDPATCPCNSGFACYQGVPRTAGIGSCVPGTWNCSLPVGQQCAGQVLPAAAETCNGLDDDCNGLVDDNNPQTSPCGPGVCASAKKQCVGGAEAACDYVMNPPPSYAANEICGDGLDNECDGLVDDGCVCTAGNMVSCWTGSSSACPNDGGPCRGVCQRGTQTCANFSDGGVGWGACTGQTPASSENCSDSQDNDCDGTQDCMDSDCSGRTCGANGRVCSGGTCQCTVPDGGMTQGAETVCNDGYDNDCDGLVDCAESACNNNACGGFGRTCVGTTCSCVVIDGGTSQAAEMICNDGRDNDCDGLVDCAETACNAAACGLNGRVCSSGSCTCSGNGGTAQTSESSCTDGFDNDCDGQVDCADSNCNGSSCGANGRTCSGGACTCSGNGGTAQTMESTCNDGKDNDCDGLTDCADSNCAGATCGSNGRVCSGTTCACSGNGGTAQSPESTCNDAHDNDCDGTVDCADTDCAGNAACMATTENCKDGIDNDLDTKTDCADTDCNHKVCGATSNFVCCGTTCTDLTQQGNCGQCGLSCLSGSTCMAVGSGSHMSGTCTCPTGMNSQCPTPAGYNAQTCVSNQCTCSSNDDRCGNAGTGQGSRCIDVTIDYCHYQ